MSKPSHHWSISCSDLTMTDPCCLTALAEAASSPYSAEADLQMKFVVFDKRDLVAFGGC